ncbi:MAG TPA: hypothetical protein DCE41_13400 [Cytophagales bacterium]|nr:hypothetical protein [Cytophagales bacterium]HAA22437.1 hypothetical protein [Cytophagales bacterium]HAP59761.1 hypothetical protein [Cytophagales bacterium]
MKFSVLGIMAVLAITLSSCTDAITRGIRGDWALTSYSVSGVTSTETLGVSVETGRTVGTATDITLVVTYDRDGSYTSTGNFDLLLTSTAAGISVDAEIANASSLSNGTYTIEDVNLTMSQTGADPLTGTVVILDDTMTYTFEETETQSLAGITTTEETTTVMTFSRN